MTSLPFVAVMIYAMRTAGRHSYNETRKAVGSGSDIEHESFTRERKFDISSVGGTTRPTGPKKTGIFYFF